MTQKVNFAEHLHQYYHIPSSISVAPNNSNFGSAHVSNPVIVGGRDSSGRHVQIVASTPETIRKVRRNEQEDRENSRGTIAATLGGIGTVICAGFAASKGKNLFDSSKELKLATTFRDDQLPQIDKKIQERLRPILNKHIENLESKEFWCKVFVVFNLGLLICANTAFLGGVFVSPWLMTAAVIGSVLVIAGGVFSGVWYCLQDYSLPPEMIRELEILRIEMKR